MDNNCINAFLKEHAAGGNVSFHMPGHKGAAFYKSMGYGDMMNNIADFDITEIKGADNLFQPESIIRLSMDSYKRIFGTISSRLLINGSSCGITASIMTAAPEGKSIVIARNSHKSVYNSVLMTGLRPVYAYPDIIEEYGISGAVQPEEIERCLDENPDACAVIIPSPNYYGICSDIRKISEIVHRRGKLLIVDQAHGAHLALFEKYLGAAEKSAEAGGADIVINSTHKTLASFTQTAIANICTDRVPLERFDNCLQMMESSSPSYLLMASLDINAHIIEEKGQELIEQWQENIDYFYKEAESIRGLRVLRHEDLDYTKINLDMSRYGIDGYRLEELLMEKKIYPELSSGTIVMCMSGIGNTRDDYEKLLSALREIASEHKNNLINPEDEGKDAHSEVSDIARILNGNKGAIWQGVPEETELVPATEAGGRVSAVSVIPYPPGVPVICPGEVIDDALIRYINEVRRSGHTVMGIDENGMIRTGK